MQVSDICLAYSYVLITYKTFLIGNIKIRDIFWYLKNTTYDTIDFDVLDTIHKNDTDKMYSMTRAAQ